MKLKHLLFTAALFILFSFSNAQIPEFVKDNVKKLVVSGDKLFIETYDYRTNFYGLWVSDGTAAGTILLKELRITKFSNYTEINGKTYFIAEDAEYYADLWATDGTAAGTHLVKKLKPAYGNSALIMAAFNNKLYLFVNDGVHGNELWVSDGTENGTKLFKDINPGSGHGLPYSDAIVYKNKMYFGAFRKTESAKYGFDVELWVSDGTDAGTKLFKDIDPKESSYPRGFTIANDKLFFNATTPAEGTELWVSDGTEEGTYLLKDIAPNNEYDPARPHEYNGKTYFITHGNFSPYRLWVTDGTKAGTIMLEKDVGFRTVEFDGALYFSKYIGTTNDIDNYDLYKTTGEPGGASLVKTISGGTDSGYPIHFRAANGKLYFMINDAEETYNYSDLWETDGTAANTKLVEMSPGKLVEASRENDLTVYNNNLFFVMKHPDTGSTLYKIGNPSTAVTEIATNNSEMVLFPNPASTQLTIKVNEKLIDSNFSIINIIGQTVHSGKINSDNTLLEVGDLPGGIYLVQIQSKNGGFTSRFMKE